jgi:hypothetical protein
VNRATPLLAAVFPVLALMGASSTAIAQDEGKPLVVIDLRPQEETEGSSLMELSGKCNQDVFRIPDVASDPLKVNVLKADLEPLLGTSGRTLTVLNWSVYYNKQVQKDGSFLKGFGVQGYSVPTADDKKKAGSKCPQKESAGGWYQAKELTSVYFPLISEFTGTFGGRPVSVRIVYSPTRKLPGKFEGDAADTEALLEAVHRTSEAVATAMLQ